MFIKLRVIDGLDVIFNLDHVIRVCIYRVPTSSRFAEIVCNEDGGNSYDVDEENYKKLEAAIIESQK